VLSGSDRRKACELPHTDNQQPTPNSAALLGEDGETERKTGFAGNGTARRWPERSSPTSHTEWVHGAGLWRGPRRSVEDGPGRNTARGDGSPPRPGDVKGLFGLAVGRAEGTSRHSQRSLPAECSPRGTAKAQEPGKQTRARLERRERRRCGVGSRGEGKTKPRDWDWPIVKRPRQV